MKDKYINEVKIAQSFLNGDSLQHDELDMVEIAVKYLLKAGKDKSTIIKTINSIIGHNNYSDFASKFFNRYANKQYELTCQDSIPIYQSEIDKINTAKSVLHKNTLFMLLLYAKIDGRGWYNESIRGSGDRHFQLLFKSIKNKLTKEKQLNILHDLYSDGFISLPYIRNVSKVGLKLEYIEENTSSKVALEVVDINDCLHQFAKIIGQNTCKKCGKIIAIKSNNQSFCSRCSRVNNRKKTNSRVKKSRFKANVTV